MTTAEILVALAIVLLFGAIIVLGTGERLDSLQKLLMRHPIAIAGIISGLWTLHLVHAVSMGTANPEWLVAGAAYLAVPFLLLIKNRGSIAPNWLDLSAILFMWLPIEIGPLGYAFAQALAITSGILAFAAWRRFPGIGYRFDFDGSAISVGLRCFLKFALIAIPLGFAIGFIDYTFELRKLITAPLLFVGIFFGIAFPEEFLFRGLIQNWIERMAGNGKAGLIGAAIVFGAAHLNNGPPVPNLKYFLMATIAGIFYGLAWQRTRSLTASATTHALVNTVWGVFFR